MTRARAAAKQPRGPGERAVAAPPAHPCDHLWALYQSTPDLTIGVTVIDTGRSDVYFCQRDPSHMRLVRRYQVI